MKVKSSVGIIQTQLEPKKKNEKILSAKNYFED